MNPEKAMVLVQAAIETRHRVAAHQWYICWLDNAFQCRPSIEVRDDGNIFLTFTDDAFLKGFTNKQWDECKNAVAKFFERKEQNV